MRWLIQAQRNGAYGYTMPDKREPYAPSYWDNSNSQYGLLGVWSAAEAGVEVPDSYWRQVEQHWATTQLREGTWSYHQADQAPRLSMTLAGLPAPSICAR